MRLKSYVMAFISIPFLAGGISAWALPPCPTHVTIKQVFVKNQPKDIFVPALTGFWRGEGKIFAGEKLTLPFAYATLNDHAAPGHRLVCVYTGSQGGALLEPQTIYANDTFTPNNNPTPVWRLAPDHTYFCFRGSSCDANLKLVPVGA